MRGPLRAARWGLLLLASWLGLEQQASAQPAPQPYRPQPGVYWQFPPPGGQPHVKYPPPARPPPTQERGTRGGGMIGLGATGGLWHQSGGAGEASDLAYQFGLWGEMHASDSLRTARGGFIAAIGGGPQGFESRAELSFAFGGKLAVDDEQGPVLRAGISVDRWRNDVFHYTNFTLPTVEAGYQLYSRDLLLEAVVFGGAVLLGELSLGSAGARSIVERNTSEVDAFDASREGPLATRRLGASVEAGVDATVQLGAFRFSGQLGRIFARTHVDVARAHACGAPVTLLMLCAEGAAFRGDLPLAGGAAAPSFAAYAGLRASFGLVGIL